MSLLAVLAKGGVIVWLILLISVVGLGVFIERLIVLRRAHRDTTTLLLQIRNNILSGHLDEAHKLAETAPGPVAALVAAGLRGFGRSREEVKSRIEEQARLEVHKLERNLNVIATVAAVSPLLGFLGTVTGMIRAFMAIEAAGGNVDATVLAGGIWEALITTAVGLSVGIPFYFFYNYLVGKVHELVFEMEKSALEILDMVEEKR